MTRDDWKAVSITHKQGYEDFVNFLYDELSLVKDTAVLDSNTGEDAQEAQNRLLMAKGKIEVLSMLLNEVSTEQTQSKKIKRQIHF